MHGKGEVQNVLRVAVVIHPLLFILVNQVPFTSTYVP